MDGETLMIYFFNNQEEIIKILPDEVVKSAYFTQELTTDNYINDHLLLTIRPLEEKLLNEVEYIGVPYKGNPQRLNFLFVVNISTQGNVTEIDAVQSAKEELSKQVIYDRRALKYSPRQMIDLALEGTNWSSGYVPAEVDDRSTTFYYISAFDALVKICKIFNIEMQFHVEVSKNKINKRVVTFGHRLGSNTGKRITYGHNAVKIKHEINKSGIITALIGRGKGEEKENEEGETYFGRKINFGDIEWSVEKGNPVNKPLKQQYVEIVEMTAKYGIKTPTGMKPKIGIVEFSEEEDREELIKRTYEELQNLARPQVLFETEAVFFDGVEIGDTVRVARPDLKLDYAVRVTKIEWNLLNPSISAVEFGDRVSSSYDRMLNRIQGMLSEMEEQQAEASVKLLDYVTSADGKNRNFFSDKDPNILYPGKVAIDDLWFRPDSEYEGETIMLQWDGEVWVEILRTKNWNVVKEALKEAEEIADKLRQEIEAEQAEIKKSIDETLQKSEELHGLADETKELADKIRADAEAIKLDVEEASKRFLSREQIEQIAKEASNSSLMDATFMTDDMVYIYNRNRLDGSTDQLLEFDGGHLIINHNGDGYEEGKTYTISFDVSCIGLPTDDLVFRFNEQSSRQRDRYRMKEDEDTLMIHLNIKGGRR